MSPGILACKICACMCEIRYENQWEFRSSMAFQFHYWYLDKSFNIISVPLYIPLSGLWTIYSQKFAWIRPCVLQILICLATCQVLFEMFTALELCSFDLCLFYSHHQTLTKKNYAFHNYKAKIIQQNRIFYHALYINMYL